MSIKITELEIEDLPIVKDWIDTNVFRSFTKPIDTEQLMRLLSKRDGKTINGIGRKITESDTIKGFLHGVIDQRNDLLHIQQILINPDGERRKGYGKMLVQDALSFAFDELALHRTQVFVDETNSDAIKFYKSTGFVVDGMMRDAIKTNDGFIGFFCMSILKQEFKKMS